MNYITGVVNDIGIEKETNQDSVLLKTGNYGNYNIAFSVVCDGMGGLSEGELASAHVVTKLSDTVSFSLRNSAPFLVFPLNPLIKL